MTLSTEIHLFDCNGVEMRPYDMLIDIMYHEPQDRFSVLVTPQRRWLVLDENACDVYQELTPINSVGFMIVGTCTDSWESIINAHPAYFKEK